MRKILYFILIPLLLACSDDKDGSKCLKKNFLDSILIKPNDCVVFNDNPDLTFTFLGIEPYTKTHPNNVPHAKISARLQEGNSIVEFYSGMVYEDIIAEGTSFSGRVHAGINNKKYTIFFDDIEFTETETQFIFHRATIRFGDYDYEYD